MSGGETRYTPLAIAITSPPSSKTDIRILAQQSDVRCKRGRIGVIMITPAAHTFKGLAKAFVSSAGGKGPELLSLQIKNFRPLFLLPLTGSEPQFKEQGLQPIALGYSGVSRPRWGLWLRSDEVDPSASPYFYRWGLLFSWARGVSRYERCNAVNVGRA